MSPRTLDTSVTHVSAELVKVTYDHIHTHTLIYILSLTPAVVHSLIHLPSYTHLHTHTYMYSLICTPSCTPLFTQWYTHICTHTLSHTHTHTYSLSYTLTNTAAPPASTSWKVCLPHFGTNKRWGHKLKLASLQDTLALHYMHPKDDRHSWFPSTSCS